MTPVLDPFALGALALLALLALITVVSAPRQDRRSRVWRWSIALVVAGNAIAYAAVSPWIFALGWTLTIVPMWLDDDAYPTAVRLPHVVSTLALVGGVVASTRPGLSFFLLVLAALVRKGGLPFHYWVTGAFERGSLSYLNLLLNGHLGAYLVVRVAATTAVRSDASVLALVGALAAVTAVATALAALVRTSTRRTLGLLCVSQAAFIMAGLASLTEEGIMGAMLHWWAMALATTGVLVVYRAIEVRTSAANDGRDMLGLGTHAPRLAVFFTVSALALVGLPGTLGFVAEDLLFQGSLASHPLVGLCLPVATALNGISAFRVAMRLFAGRRAVHTPLIPDATTRERWALTLPLLLLVAGGLVPRVLVALHAPAAHRLAQLLTR